MKKIIIGKRLAAETMVLTAGSISINISQSPLTK
jgi:hypothetical protein